MDLPSLEHLLARPLAAILLAGILGWERGTRDKPAGLRTHMMVALGSATFTSVALMLHHDLGPADALGGGDPSRVLQGIIGGIGFLGAGSIIRSGGAVQGITTAATIWVVGSIGVACGTGHYLAAAYTAALAFLILTLMEWIERQLFKRRAHPRLASEDASAPPSERQPPAARREKDDDS